MTRAMILSVSIACVWSTGCGQSVPSSAKEVREAILADNIGAVRAALDKRPYLAREREGESKGRYLLTAAIESGNIAIAELLIEKGAELGGQATLLYAVKVGRMEMAEWLISEGLSADAAIKDGWDTPLMLAAQSGNPEMVKMLIDHGANINAATGDGTTALHFAAEMSYFGYRPDWYRGPKPDYAQVAQLLIDHGADINARWGPSDTTPLATARTTDKKRAFMMNLLRHNGAKE